MSNVSKQVAEILKKENHKLGYEIVFPMYRILPDEVKLALSVLGRHNMQVLITIKPITDKPKK